MCTVSGANLPDMALSQHIMGKMTLQNARAARSWRFIGIYKMPPKMPHKMPLWRNKTPSVTPPVWHGSWRVPLHDPAAYTLYENDAVIARQCEDTGHLHAAKSNQGYLSLSIGFPPALIRPSAHGVLYGVYGHVDLPKGLDHSLRMGISRTDHTEFMSPKHRGANDLMAVFELPPPQQRGITALWVDLIYHGDAQGDISWSHLRIEWRQKFIL